MPDAVLMAGKVCVVTGASRGIGRACARVLAACGARLVLVGRERAALETLAAELSHAHGAEQAPLAHACDVGDPAAVRDLFQAVFKAFKRMDALVACAGIMEDAPIGMVTPELIDRVYRTNVHGLLYCSQYASRLMARSGGGSIVAMASIVGLRGHANQAVYAGSKAAVVGVARSLSKELAAQNIRVNAVAPGFIDTDLTSVLDVSRRDKAVAGIAMGRSGQPEEVADTVLYLCSDLSRYVTGQVIGVDGGMIL
jgi:3-oxoacyl-[acyl-carrier protein] reductase